MNEPVEINANEKELKKGFYAFTPNKYHITNYELIEALKKSGLNEEQILRVLNEVRKKSNSV